MATLKKALILKSQAKKKSTPAKTPKSSPAQTPISTPKNLNNKKYKKFSLQTQTNQLQKENSKPIYNTAEDGEGGN